MHIENSDKRRGNFQLDLKAAAARRGQREEKIAKMETITAVLSLLWSVSVLLLFLTVLLLIVYRILYEDTRFMPATSRSVQGLSAIEIELAERYRMETLKIPRVRKSRTVQIYTSQWYHRTFTSTHTVIIVCHGLSSHSGRFIRNLPHFLQDAKSGVTLWTFDYEGHGRSGGLHGYIPNISFIVEDLLFYIQHARSVHPAASVYLIGESLGGLVALLAVLRLKDESKIPEEADQGGNFSSSSSSSSCFPSSSYSTSSSSASPAPSSLGGVALLGPLIVPSSASTPSPLLIRVGQLARRYVPHLPVVAGNRGKNNHPSVAQLILEETTNDPLYYSGRMRIGTGLALKEAFGLLQRELHSVDVPLLIQHGENDKACDISGSERLFALSSSSDKTFLRYPGAHHNLLSEPPDIRDKVLGDLVDWLQARLQQET